MNLPVEFTEKMKTLMNGEEYKALLASYSRQESKGIRANTLKLTPWELADRLPFNTTAVPWCPDGFYIDHEIHPGKNPDYYAGLYYAQEPTAMAPVEALDVQPGDWVLDLCAAPGGKSTQIAGKLQGKGLLVANELINSRAGILSTNVERMGISNMLVTNEFPERLADSFYEAFDKILVDAPCSGEGMFRKDAGVLNDWSPERIERCASKQEKILDSAHRLLKPGGILVYSTCTFSPEENEWIIEAFLKKYDYELEPVELNGLKDHGRTAWTREHIVEIEKTLRIMPVNVNGEGHFIAKLRKLDSCGGEAPAHGCAKSRLQRATRAQSADYQAFCDKKTIPLSQLYTQNEHLYCLPEAVKLEVFSNLKVLRPGLHLGMLKKNRFEPAYALATCT